MAAEGSDCLLSGSGRGTALRQFRSTSASDPEKGLVVKHPGTASLSQSDPIRRTALPPTTLRRYVSAQNRHTAGAS